MLSLASSAVGQSGSGVAGSGPALSSPATLEEVSRPLLGARYLLSALGEGHGQDSDPRFRLDAFDCTTFVETVVALAVAEGREDSEALPEAAEQLDRLRYLRTPEAGDLGSPRFEDRAHLIAAQWLPRWQALGLLEDVTGSLVEDPLIVSLDFDQAVWRDRRVARQLELPLGSIPFGVLELAVVPLDLAQEVLSTASPGLLINVVRRPGAGVPILVSHQALLLDNRRGQRVVRHASQSLGRVADQTPAQFVRVLRSPKKWPVVGINLQRIRVHKTVQE